jgi:hypothetical protein
MPKTAITKGQKENAVNEILLTPSAAARALTELGFPKSEGWVRYAALNGKLPCLVTSTGRRLFKQSDVEQFVRSERGTAEKTVP